MPPCTYLSPLADYEREAVDLHAGVRAGDGDAAMRFKWMHPSYRGQPLSAVDPTTLTLDDARLVVARGYAFADWAHLATYRAAMDQDAGARRFEDAVEAAVHGDEARLVALLAEDAALVRQRSTRVHHATLLHYLAANGVENERQRTPANALAIMRLLLEAEAEVDALADMYDHQCTTMSMLVSSSPPNEAGTQVALAELLLDHGAAFSGPGTEWQSAVMTALVFGFPDTARALVRRGAPVASLPAAAGLGLVEEVRRLLPVASALDRHRALALASQLGAVAVVELLLDAGEDPDRLNPDGFHSHATPLHHAALAGHVEMVQQLLARGARTDIRDTIYDATPLGWAEHGEQHEVVALLEPTRAPRLTSTAPVFLVADVAATMDWYRANLGFTGGGSPEAPPHAFGILSRDGVEIMLQHLEGYAKPRLYAKRGGGVWDAYVRMDGVRALHERIVTEGAVTMVEPLTRQWYGDLEFVIEDVNGYVLVFSEGPGA